MSDYKKTRDAAGNVTSQYGQMLQNLDDDLVERLRNTPNWMREGFQDWKDNVRTYDRTPFEAADRIEELEAKLKWAEISSIQADRIEELQAQRNFAQRQVVAAEVKLAQAVEALTELVKDCEAEYQPSHGAIKHFCRTTLAELKGEK